MSESSEILSQNLAHNLQELRGRRQLSQVGLAKLAGLPRSTVANLESGAGNPSLHNLAKLSAALQVPIEEILAAPRVRCKLSHAHDLPIIRKSQGAALLYKLLPDPIPGMEMNRMEIEPAARMMGAPHTAGTREYLICIQGEVTVTVEGESYRVREGDVLAFPGESNHSYHNTGSRKCVSVSVVVLAPVGF